VLLQKGGPLVIRRLCAAMGPEVVFREFASILDQERDLSFASTMVQVR
jgi:vacuole morphology and inheritance protein 14